MNTSHGPASTAGKSASGGPGRRFRFAIVRALFGLFPPFTLNRLRLLALKFSGMKIGQATLFWGLPQMTGPGEVNGLKIGMYCGFNDGCVFDLASTIAIGNHVAVGHEVRFLTSRRSDDSAAAAPITIEDGVWLGTRATICGGVTVGAGSVIGAGVTVAADVPPNTLMTGGKPVSLAKWRSA